MTRRETSELDAAAKLKAGRAKSRQKSIPEEVGLDDLLSVKPEITLDGAPDHDDLLLETPFPEKLGPYRIIQDAPIVRISSAKLNKKPHVTMMGAQEGPYPMSMMEGRYVINPSVTFPDGPKQDKLHFDNIKLDDRYALDDNVYHGFANRKLPRHLMFRSKAPTPAAHTPCLTPLRRPRSSHENQDEIVFPDDLAHALDSLRNIQLPEFQIDTGTPSGSASGSRADSRAGSATTSRVPSAESGAGSGAESVELPDVTDIVNKNRTELADMFSDITDSEAVTPAIRDGISDMATDAVTLHGIPEEEEAAREKSPEKSPVETPVELETPVKSPEKSENLDSSHAGVYLTEIQRGGKWVNEDIPVYVTPDGKVFISSVIINQPICEVDKIQFSGQDDADDVHNKPEEGSLTFSGGQLEGWVKFPGQETVKIKGRRWDPRQTGHYVLEAKREDKWEPLPLQLAIMLGGKVTANEEPVHNPAFDGDNVKLDIKDKLTDDPNHLVAVFDPYCMELSGVLTDKPKTSHPSVVKEDEVEIRGHKWDPAVAGHYYCQQGTEAGWKSIDLTVAISESGIVSMDQHEIGLPKYSGNEMELVQIDEPSLPDRMAVAFGNGRFTGTMEVEGKVEDVRGVRWDPSMVGCYSTQELIDNTWVNKGMILTIDNNANVAVQNTILDSGFIVDNKVFVINNGGLDDFFKNSVTGPVSDATLAGQSFLMQRDSPVISPAPKPTEVTDITLPTLRPPSIPDEDNQITNAEIVFSSNRCYGHITEKRDDVFREIRGYKWDPSIAGEYYTEILRPDGTWEAGPTIKVTDDGCVTVNKGEAVDVLLKDNIVSINDAPGTEPIKHCLVAIQDNILDGWVQSHPDATKAQIRGSIWKEGPGASGAYITNEKINGDWYSSDRAVNVNPDNKVRISEMNLEGEMDGQLAKLNSAPPGDECGELLFDEDTFTGWVKEKEDTTELKGYKFDGLVPGVYLLDYKDMDGEWAGLDTQLVVSEGGSITLGGTAVKNVQPQDNGYISFEHDRVLENTSFVFSEGGVLGQGKLIDEDLSGGDEVTEIRGLPWHPKIAGKYETEIFTGDGGWKAAKSLEVTPQGKVLYGGVPADGVRLDTDTLSFTKAGNLEDATLSFDNAGFTGNVTTAKDGKNRCIRGRRVGTRPVSGASGTALSLADHEEEEYFENLNGQIGSKLSDPVKGEGGQGMTSDYGSASDVVTQQLSGSRTEGLSSLEEDIRTPTASEPLPTDGASAAASVAGSSLSITAPTPAAPTPAAPTPVAPSPAAPTPASVKTASPDISKQSSSPEEEKEIELDDIGLEEGEDGGVQFESWPPANAEDQGDVQPEGVEEEEEGEGVKLDMLPQGLSPLSDGETKTTPPVIEEEGDEDDDVVIPQKSSSSLSNKSSVSKRASAVPSVAKTKSPESRQSVQSMQRATPLPQTLSDKEKTPLPDIPQRSLQQPALTRAVKLPGIDVKEKGGAAEITEDAGKLKNYMEKKPKRVKKTRKPPKPKKTKQSTGGAEDFKKVRALTKDAPDREKAKEGDETPSLEERSASGIERAKRRRSEGSSSRTPLALSDIERDSSRDTTPATPQTPTSLGGSSTSSMPKREFQGALMAAKKINSSPKDDELDIPSDVKEYPAAENVAERFGMEMRVKSDDDEDDGKLTAKERRELARARKKEEAERRRLARDEEKRRQKEEEERKLAEEAAQAEKRKAREEELARQRAAELQRRRDEAAAKKQAKLDEMERRKREEEKMLDAKKKLEEELKRRREAEAERLLELERQRQLEKEREREEELKRFAEAEALRAEMEKEMAKELAEYERKVREEEERQRIEDALKAEAERRLLDAEERRRIIALARHLWNKGVRIEGGYIQQELQISSIFYSYFNYLNQDHGYDKEIDYSMEQKLAQSNRSSGT